MLAEDRNQMKTNARWKLGKEWGCIDENRNRTLHNLISIYTLDVRCKSLTLQVFLQVHDCMYVCIRECVRACMCVFPTSVFTCANRCFVSPMQSKGQAPPSFSHLLTLFSPFTSICSSGPCGWHLRPSGDAEESVHLQNSWSYKKDRCPLSDLNNQLGN